MSDLPKPVARIRRNPFWIDVNGFIPEEFDADLFIESQLLSHAAQCVAEERAKYAALVEAADGLRDALLRWQLLAARMRSVLLDAEGYFEEASLMREKIDDVVVEHFNLESSNKALAACEEARK